MKDIAKESDKYLRTNLRELSSKVLCTECMGSGYTECDHCNGTGKTVKPHDCYKCKGTGHFKCEKCDGYGFVDPQ